ncbi:MAG TPA: NfeD family protein [Candidatus Eisenbacteria bacterium]|nr:NfeD family protein [Candidatus Eisenbacteria bacterium]
MNWNWTLLIGGACLILAEVSLGGFAGFDLVLVGSAFMLGGTLGLIFHSTNLGLIIGGGLGLLYLLIGRRYVRRKIHIRSTPSNVDAVLGQSGIVLARIAEHEPGRVKVKSEEWLATPAAGVNGPIEPGTIVTVEAVDGVTLKVR